MLRDPNGRVNGDEAKVCKMQDLKESDENEVHAAHDYYSKLESHIKVYFTEIEQSIVFITTEFGQNGTLWTLRNGRG